ncbi:MAG: HAD family hydrolase [Sarcina sp.]
MDLYVSDLDGTLLNSDKKISKYTEENLNRLINDGLKFTIATARTPGTVIDMLENINLQLPVVLMNGVVIYDIKNKNYLSYKVIKETSVIEILDIADKLNKNLFVYSIEDNNLIVYYKNLNLDFDDKYYKERIISKYKKFKMVQDYEEIPKKSIINIVIMDDLKGIENIYKLIKNIDGVYVNYSEDIYTKGCYFLETHSDLASKANGIKEISEDINHDKLICFGDNTNDVSMFKLSDTACLMDNGIESLKELVDYVIESNNDNGVIKFIKNHYNK